MKNTDYFLRSWVWILSSALLTLELVGCDSASFTTSSIDNHPVTVPQPQTPASASASVIFPIEVFKISPTDPDAIRSVTFDVPAGVTPISLFLYVNNLSYQNKAAVQINEGAPLLLTNANHAVHVRDPYNQYGGIGSAVQTLELNLDLPNGVIRPGAKNKISFIMNKDDPDEVSMGFRVLSFNLQDAAGTNLIPASTFAQDDSSKWTPPLNNPSDIQAGQALWSAAPLSKSQTSQTKIIAHCNDCHTASGVDLKYFNFSNYSIEKRAQFHGLTFREGQQIASFIRSLSSPAPGTPWDPPYQPGPAVFSNSLNAWAAGAGGDAVVPDAKTAQYLPGNGTQLGKLKDSSGSSLKAFPIAGIPVAIQFAVWNQWLPRVHPYDVIGVASFQASSGYQALSTIQKALADPAESVLHYLQSFQLLKDSENIDSGMYDVFKRIAAQSTGSSSTDYCSPTGLSNTMPAQISLADFQSYQAAKSFAVNVWEMNQLFDLNKISPGMPHLNLEQISQSLLGGFVSNRNWLFPNVMNHISPRIIAQFFCDHRLDALNGPPATGPVTHLEGDTDPSVTNHYLSNMWYQLAILVAPGGRESPFDSFQNNDWLYFQNSLNDFAVRANSKIQPMNNVIYTLRTMEEHLNGIGPMGKTAGWNYRDNNTRFMQISPIYPGETYGTNINNGWLTEPGMIPVMQSVYQLWMESNALYSAAEWLNIQQTFPNFDGELVPPQNYVLGDHSVDKNTSWADQLAWEMNALKNTYGAKSALLSGLTQFTQMLWPNNNWANYRNPVAAQVPAPIGVNATPGVEQISVSWIPTSGASSYNVKRATGDANYLSVAYFVGDVNYTDRNLVAGQTYRYKVSANTNLDQLEGADSGIVSSMPASGLVAQWEPQSIARAVGSIIPDQTSTRADATWYQALDGQYFGGTLVNLARWLGGSATLSVWIKWNPSLAASNENLGSMDPNQLSGIAGSAPFTAANNGYATSSSLYWGITRAPDSTHLQFGGMFGCSGTGATVWSGATAAWNDGAYHLLTITRDAASGTVSFYVDGQAAGSGNSGTGVCIGKSYSLGRIERQSVSMNHSVYPGDLCDLRIYDQVVDAGKIQQIYQSGKNCPL